jgi:hypothetical protein
LITGAATNVLDFGADPTGTEDSYAAIQAALNSSNFIYVPPGTYKCSAALVISQSFKTVLGVKGVSILRFITPGTDGIVFENGVTLGSIRLEGFVLQSETATGGKALCIDFSINGRSHHLIRDVFFGFTGAGRWAYGLYANNFQSSDVYSIANYGGVNVGVHLENACNALRIYGVDLGGDALAERGIEVFAGQNDTQFFGGCVQAPYSKSCIYINGDIGTSIYRTAYPKFYGFHLENTDPTPSDGADVIVINTSEVTFEGFQGGTFNIGSSSAYNTTIINSGVGTVTINPTAFGTSIISSKANITDNGHTTAVISCYDGSNAPVVTTLPLVGPFNQGRIKFSPGAGSGNGPNNSMTWTAAPPTQGAWVQGDIAWNFGAAAGGVPGWVCTVSGTPGTWKAMANLAV